MLRVIIIILAVTLAAPASAQTVAELEARIKELEAKVAKLRGELMETEIKLGECTRGSSSGAPAPRARSAPPTSPQPTIRPSGMLPGTSIELIGASYRVTESNNSWQRFGYTVTLRNAADQVQHVGAQLRFVDLQGHEIDNSRTEALELPPGATYTFTGSTLISNPGASNVARMLVTKR